ncbi:MAG: hypothetical protein ACLVLH_17600, partial [Eisenbergiella massiliensis]
LRSDLPHVLLVPVLHLHRLAAPFQHDYCLPHGFFLCSCRYYIARKAALSRDCGKESMGIASIIEKLFSMPVELCYILFVYNPERRLFMAG